MRLILLILLLLGCGDDYMTIEHRIIDADSKIPLYFYAVPEQSGDSNTWRPVFNYYIYLHINYISLSPRQIQRRHCTNRVLVRIHRTIT